MYYHLDVSPATAEQFRQSFDSLANLTKYMETVRTVFSMIVVQEKGQPMILLCTKERFDLPPAIATIKIRHEKEVMFYKSAAKEETYYQKPNAGFTISSSQNQSKTVNDPNRSLGTCGIYLTNPENQTTYGLTCGHVLQQVENGGPVFHPYSVADELADLADAIAKGEKALEAHRAMDSDKVEKISIHLASNKLRFQELSECNLNFGTKINGYVGTIAKPMTSQEWMLELGVANVPENLRELEYAMDVAILQVNEERAGDNIIARLPVTGAGPLIHGMKVFSMSARNVTGTVFGGCAIVRMKDIGKAFWTYAIRGDDEYHYSSPGDSGAVSVDDKGVARAMTWGGDLSGNTYIIALGDIMQYIEEKWHLRLEVPKQAEGQ